MMNDSKRWEAEGVECEDVAVWQNHFSRRVGGEDVVAGFGELIGVRLDGVSGVVLFDGGMFVGCIVVKEFICDLLFLQ